VAGGGLCWWARLVVVATVVGLTFRTAPLDPPNQAVEPGPVLVRDGPLTAVARAGVVGAFVVVLLSLLVAAGSLVVRFRRARGTERQQLRWVSAAAAMAALAVAFTLVTWAMLGSAAQPLWGWAEGVYITLLPLAIGASILRYRLYDWTGSSAAPWPGRCSPCCSASAAPPSCSWVAGCCPRAPAWPWPRPPWPWPPPSSRPAAASSRPWTGASAATATTPPGRSPPSAPACATRSTWTPCRPSCWP
jgi:hypothetical protein